MAGIMGKDAYIKVCKKAELLEKEIAFEKLRNKRLIREVTAHQETIKARDAKIEELKAEVEKWKAKLDNAVKIYEEESYLIDQDRKKDAKLIDRLFQENAVLYCEYDDLKEELEKTKKYKCCYWKTRDGKCYKTAEVEKYKSEVRKLNAGLQKKSLMIDKYQTREEELYKIISFLKREFGICVEEFSNCVYAYDTNGKTKYFEKGDNNE